MQKPDIITIKGVPVHIYASHEEASRAVADIFIKVAKRRLMDDGAERFCVCLSGGRTILRMEELLATAAYANAIYWSRVRVFFGDEHVVRSDSPLNNHHLATTQGKLYVWFDRLACIYHISTEICGRVLTIAGADDIARHYESQIADITRDNGFDLLFLGYGSDGHTASILPEKEGWRNSVFDSTNLVEAVAYPNHLYPKAGLRITLTPVGLRQLSRKTVMLVTGGGEKTQALLRIFEDPFDIRKVPGAVIRQMRVPLIITDKATAELLLKQYN